MLPGHRGQGEGVAQHLVTGLESTGAQRQLQSIAAGGTGQRMGNAQTRREFLLQQRRFALLAFRQVVAMQATTAHHGDGSLDGGVGDGFLLGE